jgi:hypothetical protein
MTAILRYLDFDVNFQVNFSLIVAISIIFLLSTNLSDFLVIFEDELLGLVKLKTL